MKTAEIKALLSELKTSRSASARDCIDAIETLLAREAEVLDILPEPPNGYMSETHYARAELGADIRAILYPQPQPPETAP